MQNFIKYLKTLRTVLRFYIAARKTLCHQ